MDICPYCSGVGDVCLKVFSKEYRLCSTCGLLYADIRESYDQVLSKYRQDYHRHHALEQITGIRDKLFGHILDSIEKRKNCGRLLDVGTGCGFFLVTAQERGWKVKGVEPSIQSAKYACKQNDLDVLNGTLQEYDGSDQFDVITFNNVLEHSAEPWSEIDRSKVLLKPGGLIYIRFPNGFLHTQIYRWASKFGMTNHVYKFLVFHQFPLTQRFIRKLLSDAGFSNIIISNSPPSDGDPNNLFLTTNLARYIKWSIFFMGQVMQTLSSGRILFSTSLEVTAIRNPS
jgi:2-polyprenyl-3-methyl-5-hydroxy-6-metoxy-1,4-benzoquinol methylase